MSFDSHHNEFEQWLRQQAEQHRLYPDESVWNRIHTRVQTRRWYPWVLALLLITGGTMSWVMIDQPDLPINYLAQNNSTSLAPASVAAKNNSSSNKPKFQIPYRSSERTSDASALPFIGVNDLPGADEMIVNNERSQEETNATETIEDLGSQFATTQRVSLKTSAPTDRSVRLNISTPLLKESDPEANTLPVDPEKSNPSNEIHTALFPEQLQTIESVVNTYKGKRTRKSWDMQFSISPTVSYRKLIENTDALQAARSFMSTAPAIAVPELNSVVNHKPDLGLQFGVSVKRSLSERLAFTGGLQFNINKYNIRAYRGAGEMATIGLNSGGGTGTVSSFTNYRSSGGVWANWLANFYFSASAPIGFQYRIAGNRKMNWGMASTLQPSYLLSNNTHVLSTDYKNYLEVPSLIRRWNVTGQFETFVGFETRKTRWTLGPQARYQILSSYEKAYPVQEHLFDIGIKLGVGL